MATGIAPSGIDPQAKVSVLDTVKSTASSMAEKLRDIFNTMIPGRTGSWTPSCATSPTASMNGSFSSRSALINIRTEVPACGNTSSCFSRPGSPPPSPTESTSWLYGEGLRHVERTMESEAEHTSLSPWDGASHIAEMSDYESDEEFREEPRKPFSMEDVSIARGWSRSSSDPGPLEIERLSIKRSSSLRVTTPRSPIDTSWVFRAGDLHRIDSAFSYLRLDSTFRDDVDLYTRQT